MRRVEAVRALIAAMGVEAFLAWEVELVLTRPVPMRLADRLLRDDSLTPYELRVLAVIADGHRRDSAAALIGVGSETVKWSLKRSSLKLGARNTTHAVALAIRAGLI